MRKKKNNRFFVPVAVLCLFLFLVLYLGINHSFRNLILGTAGLAPSSSGSSSSSSSSSSGSASIPSASSSSGGSSSSSGSSSSGGENLVSDIIKCETNKDCFAQGLTNGPVGGPYCADDGNIHEKYRIWSCLREAEDKFGICVFDETDRLIDDCVTGDGKCVLEASVMCVYQHHCNFDSDCPNPYFTCVSNKVTLRNFKCINNICSPVKVGADEIGAEIEENCSDSKNYCAGNTLIIETNRTCIIKDGTAQCSDGTETEKDCAKENKICVENSTGGASCEYENVSEQTDSQTDFEAMLQTIQAQITALYEQVRDATN